MSENGFFRYAGKLESLPCLVEDFVYDNINLSSGNRMDICRAPAGALQISNGISRFK